MQKPSEIPHPPTPTESKILLVLARRGGLHFGHIEVFHLSATHLQRKKSEFMWIYDIYVDLA